MSLKINRGGIMALEGLENVVDAEEVKGQPVAGTELGTAVAEASGATVDGGGVSDTDGVAEKPVAEVKPEGGEEKPVGDGAKETPEATGTVVNTEEGSAVADGDAIAILDVVAPAAPVENDIVALEEAVGGVVELTEQIEEAQAVIETVEGINAQLELAADEETGEGVAPASAETIRIAVEHMKTRVGYAGKAVFPAMENFGGKLTKRQGAKLALEHNQQFLKELRIGVRFAQEGLEEKIAETWDLFWSADTKLGERLGEVSKAYDAATVVEGGLIAKAWSKALNVEGKEALTSADVLEAVLKLEKGFDPAKIAASLQELNDAVEALAAAGEDEAAVTEAGTKVKAALEALQAQASALEADFPEAKRDEEVQVEPAAAADKEKIVASLEKLLDDKAINEAVTKVEAALAANEATNAAVLADVNAALTAGISMLKINVRFNSAVISYLAESVKPVEAAPAEETPAAETPAAEAPATDAEPAADAAPAEAKREGEAAAE